MSPRLLLPCRSANWTKRSTGAGSPVLASSPIGEKAAAWQQHRGSESAAGSLAFRVFPAEKSARQQVRGKAILLPGHDFEEVSSSESGLI
jgi:hypothetical protein